MKETKKLRSLRWLGLASVLLLLGVVLTESREALAAAPPQNVVVTNTPANPVPVDGTVDISGTPTVNVSGQTALLVGTRVSIPDGITQSFVLNNVSAYKQIRVAVTFHTACTLKFRLLSSASGAGFLILDSVDFQNLFS